MTRRLFERWFGLYVLLGLWTAINFGWLPADLVFASMLLAALTLSLWLRVEADVRHERLRRSSKVQD